MLVGGGECDAALRALARELGIESRVHFAGRIDMDAAGRARLAAIYAAADVFCLPSIERAESFGIVLLEAMRAGLPTIASAIPGSGINYVVRDGETGSDDRRRAIPRASPPPSPACAMTARCVSASAKPAAGAGAKNSRWRRAWRGRLRCMNRFLAAAERRGAASPAT